MTFWVTCALFMLLIVFLFIGIIILLFMVSRLCWKKLKDKTDTKSKEVEYTSLGETLKANRLRCKMTQEFVAEAIDVSRQAVSKWETNTSEPSTANLIAIAKLYGISVDTLLENTTWQK